MIFLVAISLASVGVLSQLLVPGQDEVVVAAASPDHFGVLAVGAAVHMTAALVAVSVEAGEAVLEFVRAAAA